MVHGELDKMSATMTEKIMFRSATSIVIFCRESVCAKLEAIPVAVRHENRLCMIGMWIVV